MAAVGTCTITYSQSRPGIKRVTWDWVCDASGNVSGTDTKALNGEVLRFVTNPDAVAPTDNYDITLNDEDGFDIANGLLANRDTLNTEQVVPVFETIVGANTYGNRGTVIDGKLSLVVASAGNAKAGRLVMYYR
jgi:hypothetical protein